MFTGIVEDLGTVRPVQCIDIELHGDALDYLLFDWLRELLFHLDAEQMLFGKFEVKLHAGGLTATAWGDPSKGPHGAFHKFPAGFATPLHTHSSDLRIVVISGTMSMTGEDGNETKLPAAPISINPIPTNT